MFMNKEKIKDVDLKKIDDKNYIEEAEKEFLKYESGN